MPTVIETGDRIAVLTLNRPNRLNAMDEQLRTELARALRVANERQSARAIVITGAGNRGFCAGQDLRESGTLPSSDGDRWLKSWQDLFYAVLECKKPLIAAINGIAAGGGFEFAMCCDLRVAVPEADCLLSEIDVGLPTLMGSYMLRLHTFSSYAYDLVLLGRRTSAVELHHMGVIHSIVERSALLATAYAKAEYLLTLPVPALRAAVEMIRSYLRDKFSDDALFLAIEQYQTAGIASGEHQKAMADFFRR